MLLEKGEMNAVFLQVYVHISSCSLGHSSTHPTIAAFFMLMCSSYMQGNKHTPANNKPKTGSTPQDNGGNQVLLVDAKFDKDSGTSNFVENGDSHSG